MNPILFSILSLITGVLNFNSSNGLSNGYINDLSIDNDGYVWLATNSGICRFDGERFRYAGDGNHTVNTMLFDPETNFIYFGTEDGLSVLDCDLFSVKQIEGIMGSIRCLTMSGGQIWAGNRYGALYSIDKKTHDIKRYHSGYFKEMPASYLSLCQYGEYLAVGHIAEGFSLLNLETEETRHFINDPDDPTSLPGNKVYHIFQDSASRLWIGTNKGLALFNKNNGTFISFPYDPLDSNSIISDNVKYITELSGNKLWIGTDIGGISILDLNQIRYGYSEKIKFINIHATGNEYGIASKNIRSIKEDSFHNIWIAHYGNGLDCIPDKGGLFHSLHYSESLYSDKNKPVSALAFDEDGRLWMGTNNEVIVLKKNVITDRYSLEQHISRSNAQVFCILHDGDYTYLGLYDHGILRLDKKTGMVRNINIGSDVDVNYLWKDHDNTIWAGTKTGVVHLSPAPENRILSIPSAMEGVSTYGFARDSQGRLWAAGYGVGLCLISEDGMTRSEIGTADGISPIIHQLFQSATDDDLWLAAKGGIFLIPDADDPHSFIHYNEKEGMTDTYIRSICPDRHGNMWFSTDIGISLLEKGTGRIKNFGRAHGVVEGNYIDGTCAISPDDGSIWFGSLKGLCYFYPEKVLSSYPSSDICIHECNGLPYGGPIEIKHNGRLEIRFGMKDFTQNNNMEYAYMLEGVNDGWIDIGTRHEVNFLKLPLGQNKLHIRARQVNDTWSEAVSCTMVINVKTPFLLRWHSLIVYALLIIVIAIVLIKRHNRQFRERAMFEVEREKNINEKRLYSEKQEFFTSVTHELRTPLTLITGPLDDLADNENVPEWIQAKLSIIRKSSNHLLKLVNKLLDIKKIESSNKELHPVPVDLSSLVNEIGIQFKELNTKHSLQYIIEIPEKPKTVYADTSVIRTILNNLLSNAVKNTDSGTITLSLKYLPSSDEHSKALLEVKDTGLGIPEDQLDKIFDYMYQINNERQNLGSGLGLSLVKSLVDLHHARISVTSKIGVGSTFSVEFDLIEVIEENGMSDSDIKKHTTEKILLIIEDNDDIREYISNSLEKEYMILSASRGKEALALAVEYIPDIIITDIMMPGMDGYELTEIVRNNINISHIPIIVLTAKDQYEDRKRAYDIGVDSFITKPFNISVLRSRIENIFERRSCIGNNSGSDGRKLTRLDKEFIAEFTEIVNENISNPKMNLSFLQERLHMSHSSLYRKIKGLTGLSINEYIRKIRLVRALKMLEEEGTNVSETAFACGFNDISYFTLCFKKEFGTTPSEKRK